MKKVIRNFAAARGQLRSHPNQPANPALPLHRVMPSGLGIASLLVVGASSWPLLSPLAPKPAAAIQYSDGTIAFTAPPRLDNAYATRSRVGAINPTYYLTFHLPASAEEPLARIKVELFEGRRDPLLRYRLETTTAFVGTPRQRGAVVPLGQLQQDLEQKSITVNFEPGIAPGQTITLALTPERNPRFSGTYLFSVTGYPAGAQVRPEFMGYARLAFYEADGGWPVFP